MRLVSDTEIVSLSSQLDGNGLRVAAITVDFDPFDFARTGAALVDRAVAYATPWGDRLVGLGTAWSIAAHGRHRFATLSSAIRGLGTDDLKVFVGYSFLDSHRSEGLWSDFPSAEAFVPRIAIERIGTVTRLRVVIPDGDSPQPTLELLSGIQRPEWDPVVDGGDHTIESQPAISQWTASVSDAVDAIEAGELDKVVLARSVKVESSEPVAILRVFRQLVASYPQCYNFAWKSGESVFMGASPELLARVDGSTLSSNPLAGSAPRGEGDTDDRAIGNALLSSEKDQQEHRLVVEDMRERLSPITEEISVPAAPTLKRMATVQHLSTEITATLGDDVGVLEVVDALHPTPAVGGVDRDDAVSFIAEHESLDRGWYTGGVGWVTPSGDGAMAIALRCGLIRDATTHLFAGAGIVEGSQPDAELMETRLKLRPLLEILAAT